MSGRTNNKKNGSERHCSTWSSYGSTWFIFVIGPIRMPNRRIVVRCEVVDRHPNLEISTNFVIIFSSEVLGCGEEKKPSKKPTKKDLHLFVLLRGTEKTLQYLFSLSKHSFCTSQRIQFMIHQRKSFSRHYTTTNSHNTLSFIISNDDSS